MKFLLRTAIYLSLLIFASSVKAEKVEFFAGSFASVRQSAKINNRPYFAYFTASWCMPCRQMDETTWKDPHLARYIDSHYYAAKIDVEDFDGYAFADQYKVIAFPTILLFAPDGSFLKRIEGSVSGSKLKSYLQEYDIYDSPPVNLPPDHTEEPPPPIVLTPPRQPGGSLPPTGDNAPPSVPAEPKTTGKDLFHFNVKRADFEGYSVQVGVYADYENVLREVAKFQEQFKEDILVHIAKLENRTVYKVLIGDFNRRERADRLKTEILATGIPEAFVKDLSTL